MRGELILSHGWPDEMQAREIILDECRKLGSKNAFCKAVGISRRYLCLIMEWKRAPVHSSILNYFEWSAVYAAPEEMEELQARRLKTRGESRPRGTPLTEGRPRPARLAIDVEEQRRYWRQKQAESRARREHHAALSIK